LDVHPKTVGSAAMPSRLPIAWRSWVFQKTVVFPKWVRAVCSGQNRRSLP
jgi:hypothetical protein